MFCHTRAATASGTTDPGGLTTDQKIKIGGVASGAFVGVLLFIGAIITAYKCCGSKFTCNSFSCICVAFVWIFAHSAMILGINTWAGGLQYITTYLDLLTPAFVACNTDTGMAHSKPSFGSYTSS